MRERFDRIVSGLRSRRSLPDAVVQAERGTTLPVVGFLNEATPGNILTDPSRPADLYIGSASMTSSSEGFAHNPEGQRQIGRFFLDTFSSPERGALLDVGYGQNLYVADAFVERGIPAYGLDVLARGNQGETWVVPQDPEKTQAGIITVRGDVAYLGNKNSVLRDKRFGTILFNGSWNAGGNNFTVTGEMLEFKAHNHANTPTRTEYMDQEKERIVQACKNHLTPTGTLGVVSSRYAYHGAGDPYDNLPGEKLAFLDLFDRVTRAGATKVTLVGMSQNGFDQLYERALTEEEQAARRRSSQDILWGLDGIISRETIVEVRGQLQRIENLPEEDITARYGDNPEYQKRRIQAVLERAKQVPILNDVARIDAMFVEF